MINVEQMKKEMVANGFKVADKEDFKEAVNGVFDTRIEKVEYATDKDGYKQFGRAYVTYSTWLDGKNMGVARKLYFLESNNPDFEDENGMTADQRELIGNLMIYSAKGFMKGEINDDVLSNLETLEFTSQLQNSVIASIVKFINKKGYTQWRINLGTDKTELGVDADTEAKFEKAKADKTAQENAQGVANAQVINNFVPNNFEPVPAFDNGGMPF